MAGNFKHVRIPFEEACGERLLLKKSYDRFSVPQKAFLRICYGLPLSAAELVWWNAWNGFGHYDDLGYLEGLTGSLPYEPHEYQDVTFCAGRRFSKTHLSAFIAAYEALFGGHKQYVGERQDPIVLQVAQDLTTARENLRQHILATIQDSPVGSRELEPMQSTVTADRIRLKTSLIMVGPPTIKLRGAALAVALLDEIAMWPSDKDAAAPDVEVEAAIRPAQLQFPFRKLVKISSPWTEEGILYDALQRGTWNRLKPDAAEDREVLVLRAPTAQAENPAYSADETRRYLAKERAKNPAAFRREYLAEPAKSVSGFLNPQLLRAAVAAGVKQRDPQKGILYIATVDPAFRRDAFAFCIGHLGASGEFILDFVESWRGTPQQPLSPTVAIGAFAAVCAAYGVRLAVSDQWHAESLQELALAHGLVLEASPLTQDLKKKMWGDVIALLAQQVAGRPKLALLDHPPLLDELMKLEQVLTPFGGVAYRGKSDDLAMAFALCVHRALQYGVRAPSTAEELDANGRPKEKLVKSWDQERREIRARASRGSAPAPWWS